MTSSDSLFWRIKQALNEADIEGLLALGSPGDEYDGEASLIENGICRASDFGKMLIGQSEVEKIVSGIWDDQFGPLDEAELESRRPYFAKVAAKIIGEDGVTAAERR